MFFATRRKPAGSHSGGLDHRHARLTVLPQPLVKANTWRVHVEETRTVRAWVRKRVHDAERRSDVRTCAEAKPLVVEEELRLSFEHVERVDVVIVGVRVRPFEAGLELELDQRQLLSADLDRRDSGLPLETFAFPRTEEDGVRPRAATTRRSVDAVETAGLTAIPLLEIPCEAAPRCMKVQEASPRRASESMYDLRWSADARAWRQHLLLVVDQDREAALEDVERIRMLSVEVRVGSWAGVGEKRLRDAELVEVRLDDDSPAEERLALAGSVHDSWHRCRV